MIYLLNHINFGTINIDTNYNINVNYLKYFIKLTINKANLLITQISFKILFSKLCILVFVFVVFFIVLPLEEKI